MATHLEDVGSRLHMEAEINKRKLEEKMEVQSFKNQQEEVEGCTFKPALSEGTRSHVSSRVVPDGDIFNALYKKHEEVKDK